MDEISQFGQKEQIELAAIIRHYRKNGLWGGGAPTSQPDFRDEPLYIKNTEANVIPAFGCVEVIGTVDETQNYIQVKKPTSTGTVFLFNGYYDIEANGYGKAQIGDVIRAYKSTGTVTFGNRWRPTPSQYYLTKGIGNYIVLGSDDIGTDVIRFRFDPSVRMYRFALKAAWSGTPKKASCDIFELDGTDTTIDEDVYDYELIFQTLTTGDTGYCIYQDNKLTTIQAPCPVGD